MRLTKTLRDAFVRSVVNDVPKVDYDSQCRKLIEDHLDALFQGDFPGHNRQKAGSDGWLRQCGYILPPGVCSVYTYGPLNQSTIKRNNKLWDMLEALGSKNNAQNRTLNQLADKLRAVTASVNTWKALADALPEFKKYLPEDAPTPVAPRSLPVVINVVNDFRNAGWPKSSGTT